MKNRLGYQTSEYDCGPTTLVNAFRYLFEREEILPEIIRAISLYTLDSYDKEGEFGKNGTSRMAMMFLSNWFNHFSATKKFPVYTELLTENQVWLGNNSRINECLHNGGAVIICVWLEDCRHYVLLTGVEENYMCLFDPYDWEGSIDENVIRNVPDQPNKMNRKVLMNRINEKTSEIYALGAVKQREAMLLYNTNTSKIPEKTIEYFI